MGHFCYRANFTRRQERHQLGVSIFSAGALLVQAQYTVLGPEKSTALSSNW